MNAVSLPTWALGAAAGVVLLLALVVVLLAIGARRRAQRRLQEAEASEAELRERLEALEQRLSEPDAGRTTPRKRRRDEKEYVITSLGENEEPAEVEQVEQRTLTAPAFADAVFRETLVHSAALVHGVRRAFSPEVRFKIRYEMHREVKRSRKDRKSEMREALREHRARQRAAMAEDDRDVRMEDSA